jgi:phosphoribosylformimino-5-aminoimidazole carboxamide ribonucleotide (ProFAR) isomerase
VIVGTRAVKNPEWLRDASREFRSRLWVAVDARKDRIVAHGWTRRAGVSLSEYLRRVDGWPFGGYLYTNVNVEGRLRGIDRPAVRRIVGLTDKPVIYSGGVTSLSDVRTLKRLGVRGAIVGAAIYREALPFEQALRVAR